jgi:hypothetical protein
VTTDTRGRLFELTITYVEDDEKRERCTCPACKLGGDSDPMFYVPSDF